MSATKAGIKIGQAIARDVLAEGWPREWTGIDAQDGDIATAAGINPDTPEWEEMERIAEAAYRDAIEQAWHPRSPPPAARRGRITSHERERLMSHFEMGDMTAAELADWLGWRDKVSTSDLTSALISALERITELRAEIDQMKASRQAISEQA